MLNYDRYNLQPNNLSNASTLASSSFNNSSFNNSSLNNSSLNVQENIRRISDRYGMDFSNALGGLYTQLTGEVFDVSKFKNNIQILQKLKEDMTKKYLYSLLFPEKCKGARIPTKFPTPSTTFQFNDFILITPNAAGNFVVQWCPQTLSTTISTNELVVNTGSTLTGLNLDTTYTTQSALVNTRNTNVQAFRVVSACMIVQYVGAFNTLQGYLGAGLDISAQNTNGGDSNYSNFANIDDRLWSQVVRVDEGLKIVYFPKDYGDLNFIRPNQTPAQNGIASIVRLLIYGQNIPPSTSCIRIDLYKNVEAIVGPAYGDIMESGYLSDDSTMDTSLEASKLLTKSNLVISKLEESDSINELFSLPGKDYIGVLNNSSILDKKNRPEFLKQQVNELKNTMYVM